MVDGLVDTSILVDLLRGLPDARSWLTPNANVGITPIVWMELLYGIEVNGPKNKQKLESLVALLNSYELVETTSQDVTWARNSMIQFRLTHDIDPFDFLIASTAHRLQSPLYTRNMKHFAPLLGELAVNPY